MTENTERGIVLVSGATGQQGGAVARHLLRAGHPVRALTRNAGQDSARRLADDGAEIVEGDFQDRSSLDRALDGVRGAFSVQNSWVGGLEAEVRDGKAFADAAAAAGIGHFVYTSVGGAERDTGVPHFESKWEIEKHVRALGLPATILRPVYFMENWEGMKDPILGGTLPQPLDPDTRLQQVAVDDIGAFAALAFSSPEAWIGGEVELAGDDPTMTETAGIFGRVLGRPVEYVQVPWDAFEEQVGEELTVMYRWFQDAGYEADVAALRKTYPALGTLEGFLEDRDW